MDFTSFISKYWKIVLIAVVALVAVMILSGIVTDRLRWTTYTSSVAPVFSIQYLKGSVVTEDYSDALIPGSQITGVKFDIPDAYTHGPRLAAASLTVEHAASGASCSALTFLPLATTTSVVKERGVSYEVASLSFGDPRNRFENKVFVLSGSQPCTALLYTMQLKNAGAPEPAAARSQNPFSFNKTTVYDLFDTMRRSLVLKQ